MELKKLKGILFDLDNTLYDYSPCNYEGEKAAIKFLSEELALSASKTMRLYKEARTYVHEQLKNTAASHSRLLYCHKLIELATGSSEPVLARKASQIFWESFLNNMRPRSDVIRLLKYIKQNSIKMAIVTDLTTDIQIRKMEKLKIPQYIDVLVTSEEVGIEKPNPKIINFALNKLNLKKKEVMLIGDSLEKDKMVADQLQIPFWHVTNDSDISDFYSYLMTKH